MGGGRSSEEGGDNCGSKTTTPRPPNERQDGGIPKLVKKKRKQPNVNLCTELTRKKMESPTDGRLMTLKQGLSGVLSGRSGGKENLG